MKRKVILLAPAGNFESLQAALDNGADAVYFGIGQLNMRSQAALNFVESDLQEIVERCHSKGVKAWLALNIIVYDHELESVRRLCRLAKDAGIDAIIAADIACILAARSAGLPVHISVQANISNIEAVRFYSQFAEVMVLARELTLNQVTDIIAQIRNENICGPSGKPVEIELFAHGALCIGISGKCQMSLSLYGCSANRGACIQPCRRKYTVRDMETGEELAIDNKFVMSPSDLCTIGFLDQILDSGVCILKLEGRGRPADYVAHVTRTYQEAIETWQQDIPFTKEMTDRWESELAKVFNRGFWKGGYYLGKKINEWAGCKDSQATRHKTLIGTISNYYAKPQIAELKIINGSISCGAMLLVTGNSTGSVELTLDAMWVNDIQGNTAQRGDTITFKCSSKLRTGDKVFLVTEI